MKKIGTFIKDFFKQYIKWIILVLLGIGVLLFFKKILVMAVFLALNAFIALVWMYFQNRVVAIELITLTSILCLYIFGVKEGMFMVFLSVLIHNFITSTLTFNSIAAVIMTPLIMLAMSPFQGIGIALFGIIYAVIINCVLLLMVLFLHTGHLYKRIIFMVTHLVWVWFLFSNFSESLLKLFL